MEPINSTSIQINYENIIAQLKQNLSICQEQLQILFAQKSISSYVPLTAEEKEKYFQMDFVVRINNIKKNYDSSNIFVHKAKIPKDLFTPSVIDESKYDNMKRDDMIAYLLPKCSTEMEKMKIYDEPDNVLRNLYKRFHMKNGSGQNEVDVEKIYEYIRSIFSENSAIIDLNVYKIKDIAIREYKLTGRNTTSHDLNEIDRIRKLLTQLENNPHRIKLIIKLV